MPNINSYQKLKQSNEKLQQQLRAVVLYPTSIEAREIIHSIKMNRDLEHSIWGGIPLISDLKKETVDLVSSIKEARIRKRNKS